MPAKKKLTKKKPAAKAAQPSSKKRPMPTKAKPAAKKAAPKAKAKPMAKKKKPAAKKPARRPFHEGGMIDMELQMLEDMAQAAMFEARNSNNPEALDRIFADLAVGIDQVRMINEREMERGKQPRPNPNVPPFKLTPEQEQGVRAMNQARFSVPQSRQGPFPKPIKPIQPSVPADPGYVDVDPGYDKPRPTEEMADMSNVPIYPMMAGPDGVATHSNIPHYRHPDGTVKKYPFGQSPTQNNQPTRVPLNQPPMDRRPRRLTPDPVTFDAGGNRVIPDFAKPSMDRIKQQQAMRAMNQARFTGPQITPEMQAAARQMQQGTNAGTTPRLNPNQYAYTPPSTGNRATQEFLRSGHGVYRNPNYDPRVQPTPAPQIKGRMLGHGRLATGVSVGPRPIPQGTAPRPMNKGGMVLRPEQYQRAAEIARSRNKRR